MLTVKDRMRILRIVSAGYEQGGAENGIVLTNIILRQQGHDVRVLSSDVNSEVAHFSDYEFKSVHTQGLRRIISAAFNLDAYNTTKKIVNDFKPDVVLLHTLSQPTAAVVFALKNIPSVVFVHGPELYTKSLLPWYLKSRNYKHGSYELSDLTVLGRLHYFYFLYICRRLYLWSFRHVESFVALSHYTQRMLASEHIEATYVPNGVGLLPQKVFNPDTHQILYAGRLEKFKGVDDLLDALPIILNVFPNTTLSIAGTGSYADRLRDKVEELQITHAVSFDGHLNPQQLKVAYQKCSVFCLPSTWPETFGKVGVEAMSVGRPVVATDVGGVRDWLIDGINGYLVQPYRPTQIADRMIQIFSDRTKSIQMSQAAVKTAQAFSVTTMANNIIKIAADAINKK